jgi:hypothetical protein
MMAEKFAQSPMRRTVCAATLARLMSRPSFDRLRGTPLLRRFADRNAMQPLDPVSLAVLAIDRIGPATVRTSASGVEVRVAAHLRASRVALAFLNVDPP